MAVAKTGDDRTAPSRGRRRACALGWHWAVMKWRTTSRRFVSRRGGRRSLPG